MVLERAPDTMLSRHAWIDGLGALVKTAMVFPENARFDRPSVNGGVTLYSDKTGEAVASVDFRLLTKWKTAATSLLAARRLARPESREILIVGAGTVARSMIEAYGAAFPDARFTIWNRNRARAEALAAEFPPGHLRLADDLPAAVAGADIIATCTMSEAPVIRGNWLREGQHLDLIGAYLPSMREVDDEAMRRARVFVDCYDTTLDHIGELMAPISSGAIAREDVLADFRDLGSGGFARLTDDEITLCKNGGGAHLDLMTADYMLRAIE